ncbi:telomere resolvase [Aliarcobacter cryaerophilus]|uniref:telomere resolvase n=1 Tax=Aliarcobacter cryaerophilus TaxID=28198 RepID=UPI0021B6E60E|nr:telomere resolvase [Aliarcobacter cryaerophilus]MCT7466973.1 telomere resolvase [Aliarcobacter cryaerophilus]
MNRQEYLDLVFNFSTWKDIKNVLIEDAKKVKTKSDVMEFASKYILFMSFDSSMFTIRNRSKEIRDLLSENGLDDLLPIFKIDKEIYAGIKKDYNKSLKATKEVSDIDFNHSKFTRDTINLLIDNIKNNVSLSKSNMSKLEDELFYQKLFVLALATGRRQIELLKTLTIKKKKELALYEGLSKKRNDDVESCEAPILIDIKIAKKYLDDVRDYLKNYNVENMTADAINSKFNGRIGNAIKRYIGDYNFHYFRACYAHTCYTEFGNNMDKTIYFTNILGHKEIILPAVAYTTK